MVNTASTYTTNIYFHGYLIFTTVTKDPDTVDAWITETENIYGRHNLIVGLDSEWRISYQRDVFNPAAVLQLCVGNRCLIYQIMHRYGFIPDSLVTFLNKPSYTFTGASINNDVQRLLPYRIALGPNRQSFTSTMVDIQRLAANKLGLEMNGLNLGVLAKNVIGVEPEKQETVRRSPWDTLYLSEEQVKYASIDAFLSCEIGRVLINHY